MALRRAALSLLVVGALTLLSQAKPTNAVIVTPIVDDTNTANFTPSGALGTLNDLGQVGFSSPDPGSTYQNAMSVYVSDQFGLRRIVGPGDQLDGMTVLNSGFGASRLNGPGLYFINPSTLMFMVVLQDAASNYYVGLYSSSGRGEKPRRYLLMPSNSESDIFNFSARISGYWSASYVQNTTQYFVCQGNLYGSTRQYQGPFNYTVNGSDYFGQDIVNTSVDDQGTLYAYEFANTNTTPRKFAHFLIRFDPSGPTLFDTAQYFSSLLLPPFLVGNGVVGGGTYDSTRKVLELTTRTTGVTSVRDDGSTRNYILQNNPTVCMNNSGQMAAIGVDRVSGAKLLIKSSSAGAANLKILDTVNQSGYGVAINDIGNVLWDNADLGGKLQIDTPVSLTNNSPSRPDLLENGQPFMGDTLASFNFFPNCSFNRHNEALIRYTLGTGHTGYAKVKLNVPIVFGYTKSIHMGDPTAFVGISADNVSDQTVADVKDDQGHAKTALPTRAGTTPSTRVFQVPFSDPNAKTLMVRLRNGNLDYATPWMTITAL